MSYLTGLFGRGIQASKSARIHEAEAAAQGVNLVYRLIDFEELGLTDAQLPDMLASAVRLGFQGLNITHPFKQAVIKHLDALSDEARLMGAVNTVVIRDGHLTGHNTDWYGFAESFRRSIPADATGQVLQLGAGGAGAAVAYALLRSGVRHLYLADPDANKIQALCSRYAEIFPDRNITACHHPEDVLSKINGIVQTSPIGMAHHPGVPMDITALRPDQWVSDIIYFPAQTALLQQARLKGCRTVNGEGMVVFQAAEAFRLFTGITPDAERMLRQFR